MEIREGYKKTEVGIIPYDWEVKELGEIGNFKNGINKSSEDFGFGYPFVNLMDVFGKSSIIGNEEFGLINSNDIERKLYELKKGDVLFIRSSVKPSGVGLTCVIENNLPDIVFSGFIIRYRDGNLLDEGFKKYCFYEERFRNNLIGSSTFSANTNINQEALKKLKIPLPPTKAEQTAIATALSDTNALISSLEKLITKKRNIKQGAMQQLLQPKEGWEEKTLGEIARFRRGSFPQPYGLDKWYDDANGMPFVQVFDVDDNMKLKSETKWRISEEAQKMSVFIEKGSIVLTIQGSIGRIAITQYDAYVDRTLLIFESFVVLFNKYFFMLLVHILFEQEKQRAPGGTIKTITKQVLSGFKISYPKIDEQTRIAEILSDMDTETTTLETKLDKYRQIKQGMMQNLLTGKIRLV